MSDIKRVAVIGSGTMGVGIAISTVRGGVDVVLIDLGQSSLDAALVRVQRYLSRQVEKQEMSDSEAQKSKARLRTSTDLAAAAGSDLVIEAVFEDITVKKSVFETIEGAISPTAILATNTSALKVTDIGADLTHPERLCGMHYFSPAEINPIVEVIRSETTSPATIAAVLPFLENCGKTAIPCKDQSGFALNRFFCPYTNEAARCLDDGLGTPAQIDAAAKDVFGVPIGPFAVMNIVKPRINLAAVRSLASLGPFYAPAISLQECGDNDESWDISETGPAIDNASHEQITQRLKAAVFYAVQEALDEGVASAADIDLGAHKAFGFTKGPNEMMLEAGRIESQRLIANATLVL
jgi:3-hydroxybutyryl-CoA dehydrogenase